MSWKRLLPIGLVVLIIAIVSQLPARLAAGWLEASTTGISLGGVHGTLFNGHARYVSSGTTLIEDVHWQFQPAALLTGRLAAIIAFNTDLSGLSGTLAYTFWGTTHLSDVHGSATLDWLAAHGGYTFIPLSGDATLTINSMTLNDQFMPTALNGRLHLAHVRWQLTRPPLLLGSYSARIAHENGHLRTVITDSSGPLALQGHATLSPNSGQFNVELRLRARANAEPRLSDFLRMLGRPDDSGQYHIRRQGQL